MIKNKVTGFDSQTTGLQMLSSCPANTLTEKSIHCKDSDNLKACFIKLEVPHVNQQTITNNQNRFEFWYEL